MSSLFVLNEKGILIRENLPMRVTHKISNRIKKNSFSSNYFLLYIIMSIPWYLPDLEIWFIFQRTWLAFSMFYFGFSMLVQGAVNINLSLWIQKNNIYKEHHQIFENILNLIILTLVFFYLSKIFQKWWNSNKKQLLILFLFVLNPLFGSCSILFSGALVTKDITCKTKMSNSKLIEITKYNEFGSGTYHFFRFRDQNNQSNKQILYGRDDEDIGTHCDNTNSLNDSTFWVWIGWKFAITHDVGETWETWTPKEIAPDWVCCNDRFIEDITFADKFNGTMTVDPIRFPYTTLITTDGGITWEPQEP